MAKQRQRATGGGRKPQGEFSQLTSLFAVRMPEDIRKQLGAAAKKSQRNASQELLARLNSSFARDRDRARDPAIRALCFFFSELAERVSWPGPKPWHRNPFSFRAFKLGVVELLNDFEPKGGIRPPPVAAVLEDLTKEYPTF